MNEIKENLLKLWGAFDPSINMNEIWFDLILVDQGTIDDDDDGAYPLPTMCLSPLFLLEIQ